MCSVHVCSNGETDKAPKNCPTVHKKMENIKEVYKACGYQNIGLAFCIGLDKEAKMLSKVLTYNGFEVNSVICKNGNIPKDYIDVIEAEKVAMCNPIGQAIFLNEAKTELNIILGLCVGHDSLFIKYSKAPVTVFAVKDRVLGHNPLAVIYQAEAYYKNKLFPPKDK